MLGSSLTTVSLRSQVSERAHKSSRPSLSMQSARSSRFLFVCRKWHALAPIAITHHRYGETVYSVCVYIHGIYGLLSSVTLTIAVGLLNSEEDDDMGDIEEEDSDDEDYTAGDSDHDNDKDDEANDDYDYDLDGGRLEEDDGNIGEGDFIGISDASDEDLDCCPTEDSHVGRQRLRQRLLRRRPSPP